MFIVKAGMIARTLVCMSSKLLCPDIHIHNIQSLKNVFKLSIVYVYIWNTNIITEIILIFYNTYAVILSPHWSLAVTGKAAGVCSQDIVILFLYNSMNFAHFYTWINSRMQKKVSVSSPLFLYELDKMAAQQWIAYTFLIHWLAWKRLMIKETFTLSMELISSILTWLSRSHYSVVVFSEVWCSRGFLHREQ